MPKKFFIIACLITFGFTAAAVEAAPVLVEPEWLQTKLKDKDLVLIDMSGYPTQYDRFHIPGAVHLPYSALVGRRKKDGVAIRVPDANLFKLLGLIGVDRSKQVVIYDDMGGLHAGRLFWELERIGHPQVSVLNGGLVSWILQGRKVVNTPVKPKPLVYKPVETRRDNEASLADVEAAKGKGVVLLDVRSQEEYVGDLKKKAGGHIPSARWWEWSEAVDIPGGFKLQAASKLKAQLAKLGVVAPATPVIAYCRSGHRASQTYLTLRSLGYENVRLYPRSMTEYGRYRKNKLVRGPSP